MSPNTSIDPARGTPYADTQADAADNSIERDSEPVPHQFPPRYSSHGAVASHFQAYGGETWIDFLRESGTDHTLNRPLPNIPNTPSELRPQAPSSRYTLPNRPSPPRTDSSSSRSSDRKRRLTTADSPMRRPSSIRMHGNNAGNTIADPIVLDSSQPPLPPLPPLPLPSRSPQQDLAPVRRQSDIVLPRWQPDSEVTQCPVCGRHFTFLFRKHHCRKCGRVVCSSCSPHRITIPRQFIVHQPTDHILNIVDLTGEDDDALSSFGPFSNPALGGGEEVRVCNPCVPDPNFSPPPQYNPATSRYPPQSGSSRPAYAPSHLQQPHQNRHSSSHHGASQTIGHGQAQRPRDPFSSSNNDNRRVSYHGYSDLAERWLPPLPNSGNNQPSSSYYQNSSLPHAITAPISRYAQNPSDASATSLTGANHFPRSMFTPIPQPPRPVRQIAEEDECPICGHELPLKGPEDDETARTQHIEECIALHSASPAPTPLTQQTSASLPNQRTRGMSSVGADNGEGASNHNRMSHAARGMFPYIATEKDCIDDEGRDAECIICLEDFEAGDKMARLVCWCKFHEKCIKEWWDKKGRGACPTHQLQE